MAERTLGELILGQVDTFGEIYLERLVELLQAYSHPENVRSVVASMLAEKRLRVNGVGALERVAKVQVLVADHLVTALKKTTVKPTVPGYYWAWMHENGLQEPARPVVLGVWSFGGTKFLAWAGADPYELDDPRIVAWSDRPIPEPVE